MADRFAHAFLRGDPRTAEFLPLRFDAAADRAKAVARAAERSVSKDLQESLRSQNERLTPSPVRDAHLAALGRPGTVCVVTGQQVGLFLGPLYTVYKAAAAIVTAKALEAEIGRPAVPIFWLQTEDHDFEEIATAHVPQQGRNDEPLALTASGESDSRVSMAHRTLNSDLTDVTRRLGEALGNLPFADEAMAQIGAHYLPGRGWVQAFAGWLDELFAPYGLVLFDPRRTDTAALCRPVHHRALRDARSIADGLVRRADALVKTGFAAPVHVRPGAPLSFFHPDGPEGPRYRIAPADGEWRLIGDDRSVSESTLETALDDDPACLSTSALLRPALQDALLPTAAYVAGPGEIDYFAQLAPVFAAFGLPLPLVVPRARFAVLEPKTRRALDELGLDLEAVARPEAELVDRVAARPAHLIDPDQLQERMLASLREQIDALSPRLEGLQPGLQKAAARTVESVERSCGKFVEKYRTALNQSDTQRVEAVRKLKGTLFPMNAPQERVHSLPYYAARYGARRFVDHIVDRCRPFNPHLEALEL